MESARCGRRKQRNPRRKNEKAAGCGNKHCLGCDGQLTAKKAHHQAHDKTASPDGKHKKRTNSTGLRVGATSSAGLPGKTSLHKRTTGPARTSRSADLHGRTSSAAFTSHEKASGSASLPGKTTCSAGLHGDTTSSAALPKMTSGSAGLLRTSDSTSLHRRTSRSADLYGRTSSSAGIHGKTTSSVDLHGRTSGSAGLHRQASCVDLHGKSSSSMDPHEGNSRSAELHKRTTSSVGLDRGTSCFDLHGKTTSSADLHRGTSRSAELQERITSSVGLQGRTTISAALNGGGTTSSADFSGKTTSLICLPGTITNPTVLHMKTASSAGVPGNAASSACLNRKTSIISAVLIVRTKSSPVKTSSFAGLHGNAANSTGLHGDTASSAGFSGEIASSSGAAKETIERKERENLEKKEGTVENGLESEDTDETKLDDNKNEIDDDLHSSDLCSSSCSDIENQKDDGFHDISGCEIDGLGETEAQKQHTKSDTETTIKNIVTHEKLIHVEVSAPDSTTSDKDRPETETEPVKTKSSEAERIAEYLTRGDTAVIFPEPVRDDQDTQIDEDAEEEEIILKCMHCPQTFLRVILLRDHMREVHPDKPLKFMCPKCDETFHQKSQLDKHLTLHSPTSQNCNICNKTFANVYRLQRHMISHDESTDLRKFKCHECGKAFKFKHHLKEHIRIHSGEKPFECANCGKRFSHSGSYSSHMTSKKCWVVSAHKGRIPPDSSQTGHNSMIPSTTSPSQSTSQLNKSFVSMATNMQAFQNGSLPFPHASLPSVPVTHPLQQHLFSSPFIPQKTGIPTFYPPHLYRNPGFMSHPVFSMSQTQAMHLPQGLGLQALPGMKLDQTYDQRKERSSSSPHHLLTTQPPVNAMTHTVSPLTTSNVAPQESQKAALLTSPCPVSTVSQILPPLIPTALFSPESQKSFPKPSMQQSPDPLQNQSSTVSSSFSQSTSSVSPSSASTTSFSEQISPDINSNTKLIIPNYKVLTAEVRDPDLKQKEDDIPKEKENETVTSETSPTSADQPEKNLVPDPDKTDQENEEKEKSESAEKSESRLFCRYCSEKFDTPIAQLQHEEFTCLKRDRSVNKEQTEEKVTCKYCSESFDSPVAQHQHERYICKQNKDIVLRMSQVDSRQSPHSTMSDSSHTDVTPNGSVGADTDEEDGEEMYKDSDITADDRKLRIRSLFTDEQLNILKAQYLINPRPRKFELIRIGNKIGFPKRVVQVWFQNMRARDRKHGKDLPWNIGPIKTEAQDRDLSKSPTYIPNVPQPFIHKLNGQPPAHLQAPSKMPGESPLDLSVRRTPPIAHGGSMSRMSTPDSAHDSEVLNLSMKRTIDGEIKKERSPTSVSSSPIPQLPVSQPAGSFKDSAIFKYMQQEGMILQNKKYDLPMRRSLSPSLAHILQNQYLTQTVASVLSGQASSSGFDKNTSSLTHNGSMLFETPRIFNKEDRNSLLSKDESSKDSSSRGSTPLSSHETSSVTSSHGRYPTMELQEDTHNLATLAEAAQHAANILSGKPKRLRKKTWRQMESEEVQLDFDDSMSNDEDTPLKKKRKSWKGHRVDRDEGLYACDQCNKMFNKQSSLARHKYEHSGARPFACDMCPKSFKHKHHLTEHKRLHSGEKPFVCKKCGKRFSHSGSFSQHMNHRYNYCSPHKMSDGECDVSSQGSP